MKTLTYWNRNEYQKSVWMDTMKPLHLGKTVKVGEKKWRVGAILNIGERYYWLTNPRDDNDGTMFPAFMVETDENRGKEGNQ